LFLQIKKPRLTGIAQAGNKPNSVSPTTFGLVPLAQIKLSLVQKWWGMAIIYLGPRLPSGSSGLP